MDIETPISDRDKYQYLKHEFDFDKIEKKAFNLSHLSSPSPASPSVPSPSGLIGYSFEGRNEKVDQI